VSSFSISAFFSVERGDIIRFFEIVNSKKKKRCKYNSINYIETIKKERIKNIFVRESVPGSSMLCGRRRRGRHDNRVGSQAEGHPPAPAARTTPREKLEHCLAPSVCVIDLRTV